jgi:hypothetical protein
MSFTSGRVIVIVRIHSGKKKRFFFLEEGVKKWALQKSPSKEGRPHHVSRHVDVLKKADKAYVCNYYSTYVVYSSLVGSRTTNLCCVIIIFFKVWKSAAKTETKNKRGRSGGSGDKTNMVTQWCENWRCLRTFCCSLHFHSKKLK